MDGLTKVTYPDGSYVSYSYDNSCRLTSIDTAYGTTTYSYDKLDRLVKVVDRNGYATVYEYDENGNRSAVKYANGIVVSYKYDEVNRLISEKALDKDGGLVAQYEYTLGAVGERTRVTELDRTVEYTYDELYRLTSETITGVDGSVNAYTYAYDAVSNRISKTENDNETVYTYNELNQLISENDITYEYDAAGNLIYTDSLAKSATYTYNAENKLIRATVMEGETVIAEEYTYNYDGSRASKKTINGEAEELVRYFNDRSVLTNVLAETDINGNELCYYTIGADLISQERDGVTYVYLYDGHGSVRGLIDADGNITDTYNYDAFGNLLDKTGTTINNYLYCGEQFDSATGLYYLRARYMNPSTGTFISMDTYGGSVFDPVSLHKYLYANANPVMNVDPSGYTTASLNELNVSIEISEILDKAAESAISFALNFYWNFKAALPLIMTAATGMAAFITNSPVFTDICARFASGDLTVAGLQQSILNTFANINQTVWDYICEAVNRSSGSSSRGGSSSGGSSSGNFDPNDWKDFIVRGGKNLKQHYLDHKDILEKYLGKKYPRWKCSNGAEEFLNDIQKLIKDGTVKYEGIGTLKINQPDMMFFRGEGMTIVTKLDGEWVPLLESGSGMDLGIMMK